ncbi:MAG: methionyl-tRNA formyltransferase [Patescibacteria group bacterium]
MKIVFMGTPEFSVTILEALLDSNYEIVAVITNPDAPVGRKQILTPSPVKILAEKNKIPVIQPEKMRDNIDLAIVAAYGKIIPKNILDVPRFGTINVHPSFLPKYRGASPIQNAILNGDKKTGVTIMKLDEEMDHGPILANSELLIANSDTYESLSQKLAIAGAELLIKTIPDYVSGKIKPVEQKHSEATYTKIIKKEDGKINWSKSASETERMIRAFYPWPTAWTIWDGKILKILEAKIRNGSLEIKKLQLEGGKILPIKEFLNGHKDFNAACLK